MFLKRTLNSSGISLRLVKQLVWSQVVLANMKKSLKSFKPHKFEQTALEYIHACPSELLTIQLSWLNSLFNFFKAFGKETPVLRPNSLAESYCQPSLLENFQNQMSCMESYKASWITEIFQLSVSTERYFILQLSSDIQNARGESNDSPQPP